MANKSIVSNYLLDAIAHAISEADGGSSTMQIADMPTRIEAIASGGGGGSTGDVVFDPYAVSVGDNSHYMWRLPLTNISGAFDCVIDSASAYYPIRIIMCQSGENLYFYEPYSWEDAGGINYVDSCLVSELVSRNSYITDAAQQYPTAVSEFSDYVNVSPIKDFLEHEQYAPFDEIYFCYFDAAMFHVTGINVR